MRTGYLVLILLIITTSCKKKELPEIQNLNNNQITILGHGGLGYHSIFNNYPPNSLESIRTAFDYPETGSEVDVQLSADGILILYHDRDLEKRTYCGGLINDHKTDQVLACNYRPINMGITTKRYPLTDLEDVLKVAVQKKHKPVISLDIKLYPGSGKDSGDYQTEFANELFRLISEYNYQDKILVECPEIPFLRQMQKLDPSIRTFVYLGFDDALTAAWENGFYGITIHSRKVDDEQIVLAHNQNIRVMVFGVKTENQIKKALQKSPDYIQTDNIPNALKIVHER